MEKNVKIPLDLFNQTIDLLDCIKISKTDNPILHCYHKKVLNLFLKKKESMDLRKSYANIIFSENEDDRHQARMDYLQKRNDFKKYY